MAEPLGRSSSTGSTPATSSVRGPRGGWRRFQLVASRVRLLTLAAACVVSVRVGEAAAQSLRGRLTEEGSGTPVAGAMVVLENSAGTRVGQVPSGPSGRFILQAPTAGTYRLRILRIGFAPWETSIALAEGAEVDRSFVLGAIPIRLPEIMVEGTARCGGRGSLDTLSSILWTQAGTALAITNATVSSRAYRFQTVLEERDIDATGQISAARDEPKAGISSWPVRSPPADSLLLSGFIENIEDLDTGPTWYGPDPEFLLSEAFFAGHCFRTVPPRPLDPPGMIGLAFSPMTQDRRADIRGTLWLDRETAELRLLEFQYTRLPTWARSAEAGGSLRFASLPGGGWIVQRWSLRVPVPQVDLGTRQVRLQGYLESNGRVLSVLEPDGRIVQRFPD